MKKKKRTEACQMETCILFFLRFRDVIRLFPSPLTICFFLFFKAKKQKETKGKTHNKKKPLLFVFLFLFLFCVCLSDCFFGFLNFFCVTLWKETKKQWRRQQQQRRRHRVMTSTSSRVCDCVFITFMNFVRVNTVFLYGG